jgi:predicted nucleic acid-binding protein
MDNPSVYVETSIISYLVARPSRDLIVAGHQQLTLEWWEQRRASFNVVASPLVLREASLGNPEFAEKRRAVLASIPLLEVRSDGMELARQFLRGPLPAKAEADAAHIALAAVHGVEYLVTWNCKHIANAEMQPALTRIAQSQGYRLPVLCTPEQLMGEE